MRFASSQRHSEAQYFSWLIPGRRYISMIREIPYSEDSVALYRVLSDHPWAVFLDSGFPYCQQGRFDILTADPYKTLVTRGGQTEVTGPDGSQFYPDEPFDLLKQHLPRQASNETSFPFSGGAIGYFAYDLGRRLEEMPVIGKDSENIPEMMVGIYDWAIVVDHKLKQSRLVQHRFDATTKGICDRICQKLTGDPDNLSNGGFFCVTGPVASNMSPETYGQAFRRIKHYLLEGDCYQVNLAQRFSARCEGDPWIAYEALRKLNAAPFSAYLGLPGVQVLSSSPERFLKVEAGKVESKPIKGTRPRYDDPAKDRQQISALENSTKDRAENLMIVDLLRNDIGKTCRPGSVKVPKLFDIESFATVHHMVSTVCGQLAEGKHPIDLLKGCFPGGSITGAPKIRAMEIIEELEPNHRGVYCGSIGYIGYDGNMDTNITIRTLVHSEHEIRFWAGGGIVADSRETAEYQESFDKAAALLILMDQLGATEIPGSQVE